MFFLDLFSYYCMRSLQNSFGYKDVKTSKGHGNLLEIVCFQLLHNWDQTSNILWSFDDYTYMYNSLLYTL